MSFKRAETGDLSLGMFTKASTSSAITYLNGAGGECHVDDESRAVIVSETLSRVGNVFTTFQSAPAPEKGDVAEEYNLVGREMRITYQKPDCIKGLKACMGSEDLEKAATAEKEKFAR